MKKILYTAVCVLFLSTQLHAQDCATVFITEYVEGWSDNKALEIYNPTSQPVDMSAYQLHRWNNGTATYDNTYTVGLSGIVPPKGVIVYVRDTTQGIVWNQLKAKANVYLTPSCDPNSSDRTFCFNGNDALTLELKNKTVIDGFGYIGDNPGEPTVGGGWNNVPPAFQAADSTEFSWTTNQTLIRKYNVKKGIIPPSKPNADPAWNVSVEWDSIGRNKFDSLGAHRCICNEQVGIKPVEFAQFEMFPNPTTDAVNIISGEEIAEVRVTNFRGQLVMNRKYFQNKVTLNMKSAELTDGLYLIHVTTASNKTATKVIQLTQ